MAKKAKKTRKASGRSLTTAERAANGQEKLQSWIPVVTGDQLRELVAVLGMTRVDVLIRALGLLYATEVRPKK